MDKKPIRGPLAAKSREEILVAVNSHVRELFGMHGQYFGHFDDAEEQYGDLPEEDLCPFITWAMAMRQEILQISQTTQAALQSSHRDQLGRIVKAWNRWARTGEWKLRLAAKQPYVWPELPEGELLFRPGRALTDDELFVDPAEFLPGEWKSLANSMRSYAAEVIPSAEAAGALGGPGGPDGDVFDALRIVSYDHVMASASVATYCADLLDWCEAAICEYTARYRASGLWYEPICPAADCPRGRYWD